LQIYDYLSDLQSRRRSINNFFSELIEKVTHKSTLYATLNQIFAYYLFNSTVDAKEKKSSLKDFSDDIEDYLLSHPNNYVIAKPRLILSHKIKEVDIYDYGVKSILFVDDDLLVDLFILNDFHKNHGVVVLSINGYPSYIPEILKKGVFDNPIIGYLHSINNYTKSDCDKIQMLIKGDSSFDILDISLKSNKDFFEIAPFWKTINYADDLKIDFFGYHRIAYLVSVALTNRTNIIEASKDLRFSESNFGDGDDISQNASHSKNYDIGDE